MTGGTYKNQAIKNQLKIKKKIKNQLKIKENMSKSENIVCFIIFLVIFLVVSTGNFNIVFEVSQKHVFDF